jgi:hypothetical protein
VSGPREDGDRRAAAVFVALHVGVACALYVAALAMGEGFAGTPMPPDEPLAARSVPAPDAGMLRAATPPVASPSPTGADATDPRDRPAPWRTDPDGRVRLADR